MSTEKTGSRRTLWPFLILGTMIALYIAYFAWYTLTANAHYQTEGFDLAIFDQGVWNTLHGRPFHSTYAPPSDNLLADHVQPILLPISLSYLLWESPQMLLLIQTVILALGALPVYLLARDGLGAVLGDSSSAGREGAGGPEGPAADWPVEVAALGFALAYLLYPPLHSANTFEFHPGTLAASFLLYALYFMRQRRPIAFFIFVILAMSTKEVIPLTTAVLGLYILIVRREWVVGTVIIALSAVWFAVAVFVVIPYFSPLGESLYLAGVHYSWLGDSGGDIVLHVITHPGLVLQRMASQTGPAYLAGLLRPLAYLPLFGLPMLLLAAPTLALNALSDTPFLHSTGSYFHYAAVIVPFVVVAAIDGAAFLTRLGGRFVERIGSSKAQLADLRPLVALALTGLVLVASLAVQRLHGYLPFSRDFYLAPASKRTAAITDIVQQVPPEGSVSTVLYPARRLSHRRDLYLYPEQPDADYVVIDASYRNWPFPPRDRYDAVQSWLQEGQYGVRDGRHGYLLLERGLDQPTIPDRFYDFVRAEDPSPQHKVEVDLGDELRLLGFDLAWERPLYGRTYLVLYWQALRPIERDLRIFTIQTDAAGEPLPGTELEFVEPVWYPPDRWSTSEVVRTETFHWYLVEPRQFGVAIGVVEGPGFWDLEKRLRPAVHSAPWDMPLIHGDTLLWLGTVNVEDQFATLERPGEVAPE